MNFFTRRVGDLSVVPTWSRLRADDFAVIGGVRGGGVYLRHTVVRKGRRLHTYWRLVRSVRRGPRVVQETVTQLGELDARGRARARLLAQEITGGSAQQELFDRTERGEQVLR